ncbi:MAG: hypothetical protein ABJ215_02540 [Alphaproteobacteria bacterium]
MTGISPEFPVDENVASFSCHRLKSIVIPVFVVIGFPEADAAGVARVKGTPHTAPLLENLNKVAGELGIEGLPGHIPRAVSDDCFKSRRIGVKPGPHG